MRVLDVLMRGRLEHLDAKSLDLQVGTDQLRVVLGALEGLFGRFVQQDSYIEVADAGARRCALSSLELHAGPTTVSTIAPIVIGDLHGGLRRDAERIVGELRGVTASGERVVVTVGNVAISGRVDLEGVQLRIDGSAGAIVAEHALFSDVSVGLATAQVVVHQLVARDVSVSWSSEGVRVEAAMLEVVSGTVEASVGSPGATGDAPETEQAAGGSAGPAGATPWLDDALALLDGVSGQLNVDLALDLTVPVLGRRRAIHRFRIPIADGMIDYRRLESDLSPLEDALLDFAMRDDGLVLERGIPLLPTRGHGKPIVHWALEGEELELARRQLIRLGRLPRFRLVATDDDAPSDGRAPSVALRELELRDLNTQLTLSHPAPPAAIPLRKAHVELAGSIMHVADGGAGEGRLSGRIAGVELGETSLPIDKQELHAHGVELAAVDDVDVTFVGATPRTVRCSLRGLRVHGFALAPRVLRSS